MSTGLGQSPRHQRRLSDPYWPFRRAEQLPGSSLYWLPVSSYPIRSAERQWLIAFITHLRASLLEKLQLRQENFVNFDFIYPDLHDVFLRYSPRFNPIIGFLTQPSQPIFRPPSEQDLQKMIESGDASKLRHSSKSIAYWLAKDKGIEQLSIFFGYGAMLSLWLPQTDATKPPQFRLPKKALAHPMFQGFNVEAEIEFTYSLRDPFLAKSLAMFARALKDDPQYSGTPFAVPLLTSRDILSARGEDRESWLSLFGAYIAESRPDNGVLLWLRPEADPLLKEALDAPGEQGLQYPTV